MTIGQKIQFLRKKLGLSQEMLAEQLFVSRQTISLWEKDQTLPTIENLMRLKDVLNTSIDALIDESVAVGDSEPENDGGGESVPEMVSFSYTEEDIRGVNKILNRKHTKRFLPSIIVSLFALITAILSDAPDILSGILAGFLIFTVLVFLISHRRYKRSLKNSVGEILQNTYKYAFCNGSCSVSVSKNSELVSQYIFSDERIQSVIHEKDYFIITAFNQLFFINRGILERIPGFYSMLLNHKSYQKESPKANGIRIISVALLILAISSMYIAMSIVMKITGSNHLQLENMWVFFMLLPIPLSSIIFGCVLRKKGYRVKKNIAIGIIVSLLLVVYGCSSFIFKDVYSHTENPIQVIEQIIGADVPPYITINTQDFTKETQSMSRVYVYQKSDVYFDEASADEFEAQINTDSKWINGIPNKIIGITSPYCDVLKYDYAIIYNADTNEFNTLPQEDGTYRLFNILYSSTTDTMWIIEYEIPYVC